MDDVKAFLVIKRSIIVVVLLGLSGSVKKAHCLKIACAGIDETIIGRPEARASSGGAGHPS